MIVENFDFDENSLINSLVLLSDDIKNVGYNCNIEDHNSFITVKVNGKSVDFDNTIKGLSNAESFLYKQELYLKKETNLLMTSIDFACSVSSEMIEMKPITPNGRVFEIHLPALYKPVYEYDESEVITSSGIKNITVPKMVSKEQFAEEKVVTVDLSKMSSGEIANLREEITKRSMFIRDNHLNPTREDFMVSLVKEDCHKAMNYWYEQKYTPDWIEDVSRCYALEKIENRIENIYKNEAKIIAGKEMSDSEIFQMITADFHKEFASLETNLPKQDGFAEMDTGDYEDI